MSKKQFTCPKCRTAFRVMVDRTTTQLTCPNCGKMLQLKRVGRRKEATGQGAATERDDAPFGLSPEEPTFPQVDPRQGAFSTAAVGSSLPGEAGGTGQTFLQTPDLRRQIERKQEPSSEQVRSKKLVLMIAGGGGALLVLVLSIAGIWMLGQHVNLGGLVPGSLTSEMEGAFGEISTGDYVVIKATPDDALAQSSVNTRIFTAVVAATAEGPADASGPTAWTPLVARPPVTVPEFPPSVHLPLAANATRFVSVAPPRVRGRNLELLNHALWRLHELPTGTPLTEPISLGELTDWDWNKKPLMPRVALSPDGKWVVGTAHQDRSRVRIWRASGEELTPFVPVADTPVKWLGFASEGQLLTLNDGVLSAWSLPDAQLSWQINKTGSVIAVASLHQDWLALGHEATIDLIDANTGKSRGRLHHGPDSVVLDVAIAPEEDRLAAIYLAPDDSTDSRTRLLTIWDLADGKARQISIGKQTGLSPQEAEPDRPHVRKVFWVDNQKVVYQHAAPNPRFKFYRTEGWALLPPFYRFRGDTVDTSSPVYAGPFERLWVQGRFAFFPVKLLSDEVEDKDHAKLQEAIATYEQFQPVESIGLELDAGDQDRSWQIGEEVARQLAAHGINIDAEGPRLRVSFTYMAGGETLIHGSSRIPIPTVTAQWQYVDEKGNMLWAESSTNVWDALRSQYRKGRPSETRDETTYYYDFPGDPRELMFEEVMQMPWGLPPAAFERLQRPPKEMKLGPNFVGLQIASPTTEEMEAFLHSLGLQPWQ
jgi:hypothetical protein